MTSEIQFGFDVRGFVKSLFSVGPKKTIKKTFEGLAGLGVEDFSSKVEKIAQNLKGGKRARSPRV